MDAMISVAEPVAGAPSGLFDRRLSQTASRPDWIGSRVAQAMPLSPVPRSHPLPVLPTSSDPAARPAAGAAEFHMSHRHAPSSIRRARGCRMAAPTVGCPFSCTSDPHAQIRRSPYCGNGHRVWLTGRAAPSPGVPIRLRRCGLDPVRPAAGGHPRR